MGIKVLTPDINRSVTDFAALAPDEVPDGVDAAARQPRRDHVRAVGRAQRRRGPGRACCSPSATPTGRSPSFHDFAERVPEPVLNKRAVESLIKAGAFDSLGHPRKGLLGVFEQIIDTTLTRRRERDQGVMSLFGDWAATTDDVPAFDERLPIPDIEFDKADGCATRRRCSGCTCRDHPLFGVEAALRRKVEHCRSPTSPSATTAPIVHVGGVDHRPGPQVHQARATRWPCSCSRTSRPAIEVTVFPRTLQRAGHKLADDVVVAVKGRLDRRDESRLGLICQDVEVLAGPRRRPTPPLRLRLPSTALDELTIHRLKRILRDHPGDSPVLARPRRGKVLRLADEFRVDVDRAVGELRVAFGHDAVVAASRSTRARRIAGLPASDRRRSTWQNVDARARASRTIGSSGHGNPGRDQGLRGAHRCRPRRDGVDGWRVRHRRCCPRPRRTGCSCTRPASTASCTASCSPRSSASAARRACCSA